MTPARHPRRSTILSQPSVLDAKAEWDGGARRVWFQLAYRFVRPAGSPAGPVGPGPCGARDAREGFHYDHMWNTRGRNLARKNILEARKSAMGAR